MRRRQFISLLSAVAWSFAVRAQPSGKLPLIGFLSVVVRERNQQMIAAFVDSLRGLGYVEGQNFKFAYRSADGHLDRLPALVEEMIALQPDVILATVTPTVVALKARTQTIPIVCPFLADPIRLGLIASDARPGGNVTGILFRVSGLAGKQLESGLKLIPGATRNVGQRRGRDHCR